MHLHIDFETRSALDLKKVGLWNYARHPSTDVWCMSWALGDMEPALITPASGDEKYDALNHVQAGRPVYAHNAPFELAIWNEIMVPRYGWPVLRPEQTYCTMAMAYAMGAPGGLEDAALALGLPVLKDVEGRALMLRMARPRRIEPDGTLIWWDEPEKLARLYAYCQQDVRVERELAKRLLPLSEPERRVWLMDFAINQRGAAVDLETAAAAEKMAEAVKVRAGEKLATITGGRVTSATALIPMKEWLATRGVETGTLAKDALIDILAGDIPEDVRQALIVRQEAGKASVAKLGTMLSLAGDDGRLHNMFQYHGAATGRWAGRGVQPHNFIKDMPPPDVVDAILADVRAGALEWIDTAYGPPMHAISQCLRAFFWAPPGRALVGGDFSGVESRGGAWFTGEQWKINAFRASDAGTGPGIYELTYAKTFGVDVALVQNPSPERQRGKVLELSMQYGGGVGALRKMGGRLVLHETDATLDSWKSGWRETHPATVGSWSTLEGAAIAAVENEGAECAAGYPGRQVRFKKAGSFLWCRLPSGRVLCYPYPKLLPGKWKPQLTYMTVPSANDSAKGRIISDITNSNTWARVATYGGSLLENVVQALCRDLLADCMLRLHDMGAQIVLHVHDEIVVECSAAFAEPVRKVMSEVMNSVPTWAAGFPLFTKVHIMRRYGK